MSDFFKNILFLFFGAWGQKVKQGFRDWLSSSKNVTCNILNAEQLALASLNMSFGILGLYEESKVEPVASTFLTS